MDSHIYNVIGTSVPKAVQDAFVRVGLRAAFGAMDTNTVLEANGRLELAHIEPESSSYDLAEETLGRLTYRFEYESFYSDSYTATFALWEVAK